MSKTFQLTVLSAERKLYSGETVSLTAPTEMGEITILADHLALISNLHAGELVISAANGKTDWLFVSGGILEFTSENECRVLADVAERVDEIDEKAVQEARETAQKIIEAAKSEPEVAAAKAALLHSIMKLRIAEKVRRKRSKR